MNPASTAIFSFPMKAADGARTAETLDAHTHLILWRIYAEYYCNHKPSVTISYKDNEFMILGASVYDQFDSISGVSFLPKSEHTYEQAPFEAITLEQYTQFPRTVIDFSQLHLYEFEDTTTSSHTMACTAGGCELK
jgi:ribonucleoside-diphosphate reductase alpha chain